MSVQTTGELPRITPLDLKLRHSRLLMEVPVFVQVAAEWLRNDAELPDDDEAKLHPEFRGFLAVRVENDTKVL